MTGCQVNSYSVCDFCCSPGFKTNGASELICESRARTGSCGLIKHREPTQMRSADKTGRNDACPCGSGKKYKKCCINKSK